MKATHFIDCFVDMYGKEHSTGPIEIDLLQARHNDNKFFRNTTLYTIRFCYKEEVIFAELYKDLKIKWESLARDWDKQMLKEFSEKYVYQPDPELLKEINDDLPALQGFWSDWSKTKDLLPPTHFIEVWEAHYNKPIYEKIKPIYMLDFCLEATAKAEGKTLFILKLRKK